MRVWTATAIVLTIVTLAWAGSTLSRHITEKAVALALGSLEADHAELARNTEAPLPVHSLEEEGWELTTDGQLIVTPTANEFNAQYKPGSL